ncbi:hypothetical protein DO97_02350 [Neosynechococcus sphagnicola sy1]|uniref:Uncharacterized protein n=1 Tax=Neosynechococcus sphagnicola sy1 TaxID=1497020 RepID=A0A098TLI2_9CYAN|nr:hypothetical protein [Neosynechococcus sphagnicola]KGF73170.1 hypothetical protein DO97_02350 [Neosynechococcus sphagnicola sy1]
MNLGYRTDLDTAKDLELLCSTVNEAIERATKILEKAKEIDEVNALINRIQIAQQELEATRMSLLEIKDEAADTLKQTQALLVELHHLRNLPTQLDQLGINKSVLVDLQLILNEIRQANESSKKTLRSIHEQGSQDVSNLYQGVNNFISQSKEEFQHLFDDRRTSLESYSDQLRMHIIESEESIGKLIKEGVSNLERLISEERTLSARNTDLSQEANNSSIHISQLIADYEQKVIDAKNILFKLNSVLREIGGVEKFDKQLDEAIAIRVQLKEAKQEMAAVRSLEKYLQNFQKYRNHNQLRQFLWKELGFAGLIIYFLSLITPKGRN